MSKESEYQRRVLSGRKQFLKLVLRQEKELLKIYEEASKQISERLAKAKDGSLSQRYLKELQYSIKQYTNELRQKLSKTIKDGIISSSEIAANTQLSFFDSMHLSVELNQTFRKMFTNIPSLVLNKFVDGKYYEDGLTLDQRIWNVTRKNSNDINSIIQQGIVQQKSAGELAKEIEQYINPSEKLTTRTRVPGINKNISYQAQRLTRTSMTHAHTESNIQSSYRNPFTKGIKWNLSPSHVQRLMKFGKSEDICDTWAKQDLYDLGQGIYPPDKVPIDHPNGLCYTTIETINIDDARSELIRWVKGEDNSKLDKWVKEYGEEFGL